MKTEPSPEDKLLEKLYTKLAKTQPEWAAQQFVVIGWKALRAAKAKASKTAEHAGFGTRLETFESPYFAVRKVEVTGINDYTIHKR